MSLNNFFYAKNTSCTQLSIKYSEKIKQSRFTRFKVTYPMNPVTIVSTVIFQVSYDRKSLFFNIDKCQYPSALISVFNNLKWLFLGIK